MGTLLPLCLKVFALLFVFVWSQTIQILYIRAVNLQGHFFPKRFQRNFIASIMDL